MTGVEFREPTTDVAESSELDRAKRLLRSAVKAAETLAEDVAELIRMRAWALMGYPNFSDMWEAETGMKCPKQVQVLATVAYASEGVVSRGRPRDGDTRHTTKQIADAVGLPSRGDVGQTGSQMGAPVVSAILKQVEAGVPAEKVAMGTGGATRRAISLYAERARQQPRRLAAGPDDLVTATINLVRRDADAIAEIARKANVPNAEIYRQAVAEYLARMDRNGGDQS